MRPLAIIPTFVRRMGDVEMCETTLRTLRKTAGDECDVLVVDDGSPEPDLVEAVGHACERYDAEFAPQEENEGFCHPPDDLVLTRTDGYVALGDLSSQHGLVSFRNNSSEIVVGFGKRGYTFRRGSRPYRGRLLRIETSSGATRVTPNHGLPIRWTEEARRQWCIYVMRRGNDWRLGKAQLVGFQGILGPRARTKHQEADAFWILSLHGTKEEALKQELYLSWHYGLPTMVFKTGGDVISQQLQDEVWAQLHTETAARAVLFDHNRDPRYPFGTTRTGRRKRLAVQAVNLMPGHMRLYVAGNRYGENGAYHTVLRDFGIEQEQYDGEVMSLDVVPHEHYVSGGIVVHNSRTVNVGLRRALAEGRDGILVNSDIEFGLTKNWLSMMLEQPTSDGQKLASVVGALLLYPPGQIIQHAGIYFSLLTRTFGHLHHFGPANLPEAQVARVAPVTGALMFIRYECLEGVGIFDEVGFRMGYEDVDYNIRAMLSGRECVYQPGVRAIHHESAFRGRADKKIEKWTEQSWLRFVAKYADVNFAALVPNGLM